jgi:aminoglycoside 3-N-acetyltransferase
MARNGPPGWARRSCRLKGMERQLMAKWTFDDLCAGLRACGIKAGQTLILHSSQAALGDLDGGVVTTVRALKEVITPEGTLLLPVFSSPTPDGVFKIKRTPSRVGLITEAFRRSEGVIRSKHPTHSVAAWGKRAAEFIAGHEKCPGGLGVDSPFHKAAKAGADVLMLGCNLTTLSLIHVGESVVRAPYLGKVFYPGYDRAMTLVDYDGGSIEFQPKDVPTDSAAFINVQNELDKRGLIQHCQVCDAKCMKFDAMTCLNLTVEMLKADPAILLCHNPRCCVCAPAHQIVQQARA